MKKPSLSALPDTSLWYDDHAHSFFKETVDIELSHIYKAFLPLLPAGGKILDAGCGSGRDSKHFTQMGFHVEAFDASPEMVEMAQKHTGLDVKCLAFDNVDFPPIFDGVFANASLLHVPNTMLPDILRRLALALKPTGTFFASFKHGQGHYFKYDQLYVCLQNKGSLSKAVSQCGLLTIENTWTTQDNRPGRNEELWLHMLASRLPILE